MSMVGEIIELANQAYKIWATQHSKSTLTPQELYKKFIEPSYSLLKEIHTDYLELYLELEERIALENTLSNETVKWFSKARSRRQVDRSELRVLEIPALNRDVLRTWNDEHRRDLNQAIGYYLGDLREYFLSEKGLDVTGRKFLLATNSDQILLTKSHTRSSHTELWLMQLYLWLDLPYEEKLVLLAEEHLRANLNTASLPYGRDDLIEGVMKVVVHEEPSTISNLEHVLGARSEIAKDRIRHLSKQGEFSPAMNSQILSILNEVAEMPNWRRIIEDHIWTERVNMETAIGNVQRSYFRVRILSDR